MKQSIKDKINSAKIRTKDLKRIYTKKDFAQWMKEKRDYQANSFERYAKQLIQASKVEKIEPPVVYEINQSTQEFNVRADYKQKHEALMKELEKLSLEDKLQSRSRAQVKSKRRIKYEELIEKVMRESKETIL